MASSLSRSLDQVRVAVQSSVPLSWTLDIPSEEHLHALSQNLAQILDELQKPELKHPIVFCFHELFTNAHKALAKRVFFRRRELSLENQTQYREGMTLFRQDWMQNIDYWNHEVEREGLRIQVVFQWSNGVLMVVVANSTSVLPWELERIQAQKTGAMNLGESEVMENLDQTEGGGYGIRLIYSILHKLGCPVSCFSLISQTDRTIALFKVPLASLAVHRTPVSSRLAEEVKQLPAFPETILILQQKLLDPKVEMSSLVKIIEQDPNLVAALLKTANSAAYRRLQPISGIKEAVTLIGLKGLSGLLYAFGSEVALKGRHQPLLTEHAQATATFAHQIAKNYAPKEADTVFAGGLLHDLGKIIISTYQTRFQEICKEMVREQRLPEWFVENLSFGLDHAELGGLVAQHWNFPAGLVEMMRYHHNPSQAREARRATAIVSLANLIPRIADGSYPLYLLDPAIFEELPGLSEEHVLKLAQTLTKH
ncbi:MAG TPA: HDOD domain-containing protein [Candidatus Ozemobacteraceae bacterium]|nr:HDOD domain-containing protein [Candidatus Ozemobacteraceae bacterium]